MQYPPGAGSKPAAKAGASPAEEEKSLEDLIREYEEDTD